MQLTSIVIGAFAAIAAAAPAVELEERANKVSKVFNNCPFPVFIQAFPNDGSAPSKIVKLDGGKGHYTKKQDATGVTLHLDKDKQLDNPLTFGFTASNGRVFYDLGDEFGNPFIGKKNTLKPNDKSCAKFICDANDEGCYSDGSHYHIENCQATDLTLTLCA